MGSVHATLMEKSTASKGNDTKKRLRKVRELNLENILVQYEKDNGRIFLNKHQSADKEQPTADYNHVAKSPKAGKKEKGIRRILNAEINFPSFGQPKSTHLILAIQSIINQWTRL
ncbi:Uncharacterized protein Adt_36135 [Abeliophyllum distichum]|uniref:Uncharacterized protein n=1 Tax=Abeliophyllum distichum TaxID=126358 RepID=A0ABD1QGN9_9LAMI